ncbi:MAG: hypothetical protein DI560_22380 [Pseudomonas putida]|nr:MAG: hypothetical protein DI560_22380 [Pseudomonas putida]
MGSQTYRQGRCKHQIAGRCAQARGLTFLVVDFLPWTLIDMCRLCAQEVRKDLIYQVEKSPL